MLLRKQLVLNLPVLPKFREASQCCTVSAERTHACASRRQLIPRDVMIDPSVRSCDQRSSNHATGLSSSAVTNSGNEQAQKAGQRRMRAADANRPKAPQLS